MIKRKLLYTTIYLAALCVFSPVMLWFVLPWAWWADRTGGVE